MAQTISIQRGQTTLTGNGTSSVTLFTNGSSGASTRVIINQLSFSIAQSSSFGNTSATMYLTTSGGGTSPIGSLYTSTALGPQITPILTQNPNTSVAMTTSNAISAVGGGMFASSLGAPNIISSINSGKDGTYTYIGVFPTNFWIGPSDAIKVCTLYRYSSGKGGAFATVTVHYSFTLITES